MVLRSFRVSSCPVVGTESKKCIKINNSRQTVNHLENFQEL